MSMYGKGVSVDESTGEVVRVRPVLACSFPGRTKQSFARECDINGIMTKYEKTGVLSHVRKNAGFYEDVSAFQDYAGALDTVRKAEDMFMSLPAKVRSRFENDPQEFLTFVQDPANADEMVDMGLLRKVAKVAGAPGGEGNTATVPNVTPEKP